MFKLLIALLISTSAVASEGPCANTAKYAAIRAYKAEVGPVQGSDGIQYSAVLKQHNSDILQYVVTISENNEDGEFWEMDYSVKLKGQEASCKVLSVKKTATR